MRDAHSANIHAARPATRFNEGGLDDPCDFTSTACGLRAAGIGRYHRSSSANHWHAGLAQRHRDNPGQPAARAATEVWWRHERATVEIQALVAAARGAIQGRAERAADHDGRCGLRYFQYVRWRYPDPVTRPDRRQRPALYANALHRAVLAHPRSADHRAQPS